MRFLSSTQNLIKGGAWHGIMEEEGYDQVNTMFTPEGRLRQVEYASKTAKRGSPVIGIVCKDGVLILAHRLRTEPLRQYRIEQKIERIDEHIYVGISGIISDATVLIENAQVEAQSHRISMGSAIDIKSIVLRVSETLQSYTQFSGLRPFGVSLIFAGEDQSGLKLFMTEPSGTFYGYLATAIGEHDEEIREVLRKKYKSDISAEDGIALCHEALKKALGEEYDASSVNGFILEAGSRKFKEIGKSKKK